jgi:hypothetical protein
MLFKTPKDIGERSSITRFELPHCLSWVIRIFGLPLDPVDLAKGVAFPYLIGSGGGDLSRISFRVLLPDEGSPLYCIAGCCR